MPAIPAQETFRISCGFDENGQAQTMACLLEHAYSSLGHPIEIIYRPCLRSLPELKAGKWDGELYRSSAIEETFPDLVRIDEPLSEIAIAAIDVSGRQIPLNGYSFPEMKIGVCCYHTGIRKRISGRNPEENVTITRDIPLLMSLLQNGRIDVVVAPLELLREIHDTWFHIPDALTREDYTETIPMYHYINPEHRQMANRLATAIRKDKESPSP